jgi:hypothetical protein
MTGAGTKVAHGTGAYISPVLLAMGKLRNTCVRKNDFSSLPNGSAFYTIQ